MGSDNLWASRKREPEEVFFYKNWLHICFLKVRNMRCLCKTYIFLPRFYMSRQLKKLCSIFESKNSHNPTIPSLMQELYLNGWRTYFAFKMDYYEKKWWMFKKIFNFLLNRLRKVLHMMFRTNTKIWFIVIK